MIHLYVKKMEFTFLCQIQCRNTVTQDNSQTNADVLMHGPSEVWIKTQKQLKQMHVKVSSV